MSKWNWYQTPWCQNYSQCLSTYTRVGNYTQPLHKNIKVLIDWLANTVREPANQDAYVKVQHFLFMLIRLSIISDPGIVLTNITFEIRLDHYIMNNIECNFSIKMFSIKILITYIVLILYLHCFDVRNKIVFYDGSRQTLAQRFEYIYIYIYIYI